MVATLTASSKAVPPTLAGKISKARGAAVNVRIGTLDTADFYVAMGPSGGVPATYTDFTADHGGTFPLPSGSGSVSFDANAGQYSATIAVPTPTGTGSVGENWYVALFSGNSAVPGPTDVPDAVAGPFELVA